MLLETLFLLIIIIIIICSFVKLNKILTRLYNKYIGKPFGLLKYLLSSILTFSFSLICILFIVMLICVLGDCLFNSPLKKLHNTSYQDITILISLFAFLINNFIFSIPKLLSLDVKYTFTENARLTQLFISLSIVVAPVAFHEWLKWHPHREYGLTTDMNYFAVLVTYFSTLFFILAFAVIIIIIFFRIFNPFFYWMLQPKSANFANLPSNHYDIDNLLKSEQEYKNSKQPLDKKLWRLSFKNANNLYK